MKTLLCLLALASTALAADEAPSPAPSPATPTPAAAEVKSEPVVSHNLHFELTIFALPRADALPLVESLKDDTQIETIYAQLIKMLGTRKAELVSMANLISLSDRRATVEDVEEVRYAVEYEPARLDVIPPDPAPTPKTPDPAPGKIEEAAPKLEEPKPGKPPKLETETLAAMATTFESKNVGAVLELESTLDPKTLRMRTVYSAQHVVFAGMAKHPVVADGKTSIVEQPKFLTNRVQSEFIFASGQRALIGTFRAPTKDGWMELFFLRATARPVK